ncbi:MAG: peptidoglycan-binding protein [bacterium]|nr:peptidoglycan-binding protein [bacterium]
MIQSIDERLVGKNAATDIQLYTSYETGSTSPTFTRNTSVWTEDIDWTGLSPWNSTAYGQRAGTLISPRHIIFATHYPIGVGAEVIFVTANNTVVSRTMTASQSIGSTDIRVGILDSDVPETIAYYPIMTYDQMKAYLSPVYIPIVGFDQEEHAIVRHAAAGGFAISDGIGHSQATTSVRQPFTETFIDGDSGNPIFAIIGDQPVLLSAHYSAAAGPSYSYYRSEIASAMSSLGGGYAPADIDLSCFDSYPYIANSFARIPETAPVGHVVDDFDALSFDEEQNIAYSITGGDSNGVFTINSSTGVVTVADPAKLAARTQSYFNLEISTVDDGPFQRTGSAYLVVYVDEEFSNTSFTLGNTYRASLSDSEGQSTAAVGTSRISQSGRYVAFTSSDSGLVSGLTGTTTHVFLRDLLSGTTKLVTESAGGVPQNANATTIGGPSDDGRYVAFRSTATNLIENDQNGSGADIFVKDMQTGEVILASVSADRLTQSAAVPLQLIALSGNGRYVVFRSTTALVPEDTNNVANLYRKDILTGAIAAVDVTASGGFVSTAIGSVTQPAISSDGNLVLFPHFSSELVTDDTQPSDTNYFLKNMMTGEIQIVDRDENGAVGTYIDAQSALSADGRYVAWNTLASLVSTDTDVARDIYLRDVQAGTTKRVSATPKGFSLVENPNSITSVTMNLGGIAVLPSGRVLVTFVTNAKNAIPSADEYDGNFQIFVKDMTTGMLAHVSKNLSGGTDGSANGSSISSSGDRILFRSSSDNLVAGDTNGVVDAFYVDLDVSEPSVEAFYTNSSSGTYSTSQTINISAQFSEVLVATSSITVGLSSGATVTLSDVSGSIISGSYVVESGQTASPLGVSSIESSNVRVVSNGHVFSNTSLPVTNLWSTKNIKVAAAAASSRPMGGGGGGGGGRLVPVVTSTVLTPSGISLSPADIARLKAMPFDQLILFIMQFLAGQPPAAVSSPTSTVVPRAITVSVPVQNLMAANATSLQVDFGVGSRGEGVRELQRFLNMNGYTIVVSGIGSPGNESDYFGAMTQAALTKYQREHGVSATGYFGPITRKTIFAQ